MKAIVVDQSMTLSWMGLGMRMAAPLQKPYEGRDKAMGLESVALWKVRGQGI